MDSFSDIPEIFHFLDGGFSGEPVREGRLEGWNGVGVRVLCWKGPGRLAFRQFCPSADGASDGLGENPGCVPGALAAWIRSPIFPKFFIFWTGNSAGAGWEREEDGLFVAGFPEKWGSGVACFRPFRPDESWAPE